MDNNEIFARTAMLLGSEAMERLGASKVAVFGLGGVGGSCAEALARSGVGALDLFDHDTVSLSNINRQAVALQSTAGRYKADVMAERVRDINPDCEVGAYKTFYSPETAGEIDLSKYDYIADAIDTVAGKVELIVRAKAAGARIVSAMGAGNRLDPMAFVVTDIYGTGTDPLARAVRKGLRARGVTDVRAVWSKEAPAQIQAGQRGSSPMPPQAGQRGSSPMPPQAGQRGSSPMSPAPFVPIGSNAFVPPACGLALAAEVVKGLIGQAI